MRTGLLFLMLSLVGCASTGGVTEFDMDANFRHRQYAQAISQIEAKLSQESDKSERLRWQLNLGLVYQAQGNYQKSNEILQAVERQVVATDFIPLGEEVFGFVVNEREQRFRLPEYEQLLLKAEQLINYLAAAQWESAAVENRALDLKMHKFSQANQGLANLESYYLSYLSAIVYEAAGKYDEAYIDYQRVYRAQPQFPGLSQDLYRMAFKMGNGEAVKHWAKTFQLNREHQTQIVQELDYGEVVIILQNGMAPFKTPHPYWPGVAMWQPRRAGNEDAEIFVNGQSQGRTQTIFSIEDLALKIQWGKHQAEVNKDIGRKLAKEALILPFDLLTGGFLASVATRVVIHSITGGPDLRSWDYLPKNWQVKRLRLPAGTYNLKLIYNYARGDMEDRQVTVRPGHTQVWAVKYGDSL